MIESGNGKLNGLRDANVSHASIPSGACTAFSQVETESGSDEEVHNTRQNQPEGEEPL